MIKAKCSQFSNCPLADGKIHTVESIADHPCELRRDGGQCGLEEVKKTPVAVPGWLRPAAIVGAGLLALGSAGGAAWYFFMRAPTCEISKVQSLLALAPAVAELESAGLDCLAAAKHTGDIVQMALAAQTLRAADAKGSAKASAALGWLFDPLKRPELEAESKSPQALPATDPRTAVRFYDRAAKLGDADARVAAAALRQKFDLPDTAGVQAGKDGGPLAVPGHPDIFQRVIAKPGAVLASAPGSMQGQALKPFDLFYVFGTRGDWLNVGRRLDRGAEGWIPAEKAQDWNVMLVMRYAPQGQRRPVAFLKDELTIKSLIPSLAPPIPLMPSSRRLIPASPIPAWLPSRIAASTGKPNLMSCQFSRPAWRWLMMAATSRWLVSARSPAAQRWQRRRALRLPAPATLRLRPFTRWSSSSTPLRPWGPTSKG
ncbi:hypothetical protein CAP39_04960 [Sphingomonas sp. IBVSS1]|nr:hypothetical protein CAP39_04960 [Sphingomonas sp. IBVSS1]